MNILSINCSLLMFKYSQKITKFGLMFLSVLALKLELFRFIQGLSTGKSNKHRKFLNMYLSYTKEPSINDVTIFPNI